MDASASRYGRISVQIDAEVSNGADRRNVVGTDTERYGGNLPVHASTRRQKQHSEYLLNPLYHRSRTSVCRPRTDRLEGCVRPPVG